MADQEHNAANPAAAGNVDSDENTQTRKTVKLKMPVAPPTAQMAATIADPLSGRDTDTGNLDLLSDTQTRKTVKLKPITPMTEKRPLSLNEIDAGAPKSADAENTNSRKVVVLKTPAAANTNSRKIVMMKPAAPVTPAVPAAASNDETVKVKKVEKPATPGASINVDADATVKLQRPGAAKVVAAPEADPAKSPIKMAPAAAKPTLAPKPAPAAAAPAPAAKTAAAPKAEAAAPKAEEPTEKDSGLNLKKDDSASGVAPMVAAAAEQISGKKKRGDNEPSRLYTVLAVASVLLLLGSAVLTTVQFLNYQQPDLVGSQIELPGLDN